MKLIILLAVFLMILINVIGIYQVNIMFIGNFVLIALFSLSLTQFTSYGKTILFSFLLALFSVVCKMVINYVFNYDTVTDTGEILSAEILFLSGIINIVVGTIISLIFAGIGIYRKKNKTAVHHE